jgi:hypothetical protein
MVFPDKDMYFGYFLLYTSYLLFPDGETVFLHSLFSCIPEITSSNKGFETNK